MKERRRSRPHDLGQSVRELYGIRECTGCGARTQDRASLCQGCRDEGVEADEKRQCAAPGCERFTFNPAYCDRCGLEIFALERLVEYFPAARGSELDQARCSRERELSAVRSALRKHDIGERWQRLAARLKVGPRLWALRVNWTFLGLACVWIGWELGAAAVAFLRSGQ